MVIRIFSAPYIDYTEVVPCIFITVVFLFYFQPFPDFPLMGEKILFRLQISVNQRVIFYFINSLIRIRHIASMGHIVNAVFPEYPAFLFLIDPVLFFIPYRRAKFHIHKIHTLPAMDIYRQPLLAHRAEFISQIHSDAPRRYITE